MAVHPRGAVHKGGAVRRTARLTMQLGLLKLLAWLATTLLLATALTTLSVCLLKLIAWLAATLTTLSVCLLKLLAWRAATLFNSMRTLPTRTHTWGRTRWEQHWQARWERDPRTVDLRMELEMELAAAKEETRQWKGYVDGFKAQVAFKLQRILAPCVNDERPMYSPVFTMKCGCTADAGLHNCMKQGGMLCRGDFFHSAHLFSDVLTSLRQMDCWMSKQITAPLGMTAPPVRAVTLVDHGTDPMPTPPSDALALQHVERLLQDHCKDPVTLEVLESPVVILGCGHAIGEQSLATLQRSRLPLQCPICRQTIRFQCRSFALQSTIAAIKELLAAKSE